jgi:hypothetical protein
MPGAASRVSERLRSALVPLLWCLMHTVWLSALLRAVSSASFLYPRGVTYPLWLVPVLLLGGALLEDRVSHLRRGWIVGAAIGLALVVGVMFLLPVPVAAAGLARRWRLIYRFVEGIPALFVAGAFTGGLWAGSLAVDWTDRRALWRGFVTGIVALSVLMLLSRQVSGQSGAALGGTMALFLFCGLLLLAVQSLTSVLTVRRREGQGTEGLERYWLVSLGLVVLAILAVGALGGLLLTPDAVSRVAAVVWPIIRIILTPVAWVFQWVGFILIWLLSMMLSGLNLVGGEGQQKVERPTVPTDMAQQLREIEEGATASAGLPPNLGRIVLAILVVCTLLLVFYLVWRRRGHRRKEALSLEDRDSVMTRDMLLGQMREWLDSLRPRRAEVLFDQTLAAGDPRQAIRILYRRLLQSARKAGHPRAPGQTPASFGRSLISLVPAEGEGVEQVTQRYVAVRYGERIPTPEEVEQARGAVGSVEKALAERDATG